jgi:hypothetical protein
VNLPLLGSKVYPVMVCGKIPCGNPKDSILSYASVVANGSLEAADDVRSAAAVITQKTRAAATDAKNILSLTIRFFSIVSLSLFSACMHALVVAKFSNSFFPEILVLWSISHGKNWLTKMDIYLWMSCTATITTKENSSVF